MHLDSYETVWKAGWLPDLSTWDYFSLQIKMNLSSEQICPEIFFFSWVNHLLETQGNRALNFIYFYQQGVDILHSAQPTLLTELKASAFG